MLCVLVFRATTYLPEPDDNAYRASIVAMTDGHFFTLSWAQAHALAERLAPQLGGSRLSPGPGGGPVQWVQLPGDRWISEKDPGYPYLAVAFPFGPQFAVVPGPGGTVKLKPGPGVMTGGPGRVAPAGPGRAVRIGSSGGPSVRPAP